jgi:hypothetical protein
VIQVIVFWVLTSHCCCRTPMFGWGFTTSEMMVSYYITIWCHNPKTTTWNFIVMKPSNLAHRMVTHYKRKLCTNHLCLSLLHCGEYKITKSHKNSIGSNLCVSSHIWNYLVIKKKETFRSEMLNFLSKLTIPFLTTPFHFHAFDRVFSRIVQCNNVWHIK